MDGIDVSFLATELLKIILGIPAKWPIAPFYRISAAHASRSNILVAFDEVAFTDVKLIRHESMIKNQVHETTQLGGFVLQKLVLRIASGLTQFTESNAHSPEEDPVLLCGPRELPEASPRFWLHGTGGS